MVQSLATLATLRIITLHAASAARITILAHWSQAIVGMLAPSVGFHGFVLSTLSTCLHCPPPFDSPHTLQVLISSSCQSPQARYRWEVTSHTARWQSYPPRYAAHIVLYASCAGFPCTPDVAQGYLFAVLLIPLSLPLVVVNSAKDEPTRDGHHHCGHPEANQP